VKMHSKKIFANLLTFYTVLILISGLIFTVYCFLTGIEFLVLGTLIPGFVFGLIITGLGLRYIRSVRKLKQALLQSTENFSWSKYH